MYEFTHQGLWFRWGALDRPSKWLMAWCVVAVILAMMPFSSLFGDQAFRLGLEIGSGRKLPGGAQSLSVAAACWTLGFGAISAILWWRFSLRQDEMFNRIQNWSLGMASAWTVAIFCALGILSAAGVTNPEQGWAIFGLWLVLWTGFWVYAVRRWA